MRAVERVREGVSRVVMINVHTGTILTREASRTHTTDISYSSGGMEW